MTRLLAYAKAHVALLGAAVTWALGTFPPDSRAYQAAAAAAAVLTFLGVATVPNKKRKAKK